MLFPGTQHLGRFLASCLLALCVVACSPDPPDLPDPDAELPEVECGLAAPLTLTRLEPDSDLDWPPWLQVCTLCPSSAMELRLADSEGADLELVAGWSDARHCAVALSTTPPPEVEFLAAEATVANLSRQGSWDFEIPLDPDREAAPFDLGSATYRLYGAPSRLRIPGLAWDSLGSPPAWKPPPMLLRLGEQGSSGSRSIELALADSDGQDPCEPTWQLAQPATERAGQLAAPLPSGDRFPTPFGSSVRRGALQAHLAADGASLRDLAVLSVVDLADLGPEGSKGPDELCADWEAQLGANPCTPCEAPDEAIQGPAHCVTTVSEWAVAPRTADPLVSLTDDGLPDECGAPADEGSR